MREPFDLEQAAVGLKADLPQRGEIREPLADPDVPGIVDRGLGAQRPIFLEVLLHAGMFILDRELGQDAELDAAIGAALAPRIAPPWSTS